MSIMGKKNSNIKKWDEKIKKKKKWLEKIQQKKNWNTNLSAPGMGSVRAVMYSNLLITLLGEGKSLADIMAGKISA